MSQCYTYMHWCGLQSVHVAIHALSMIIPLCDAQFRFSLTCSCPLIALGDLLRPMSPLEVNAFQGESVKFVFPALQAMMEHSHYLEEQLDAYKGMIDAYFEYISYT